MDWPQTSTLAPVAAMALIVFSSASSSELLYALSSSALLSSTVPLVSVVDCAGARARRGDRLEGCGAGKWKGMGCTVHVQTDPKSFVLEYKTCTDYLVDRMLSRPRSKGMGHAPSHRARGGARARTARARRACPTAEQGPRCGAVAEACALRRARCDAHARFGACALRFARFDAAHAHRVDGDAVDDDLCVSDLVDGA
eukprot:6208814-Pleurochrysis_carterae.AAC.1